MHPNEHSGFQVHGFTERISLWIGGKLIRTQAAAHIIQVLVFAIAYGFQQIQNITRLIGGKTKSKCPYQFVEVCV